MIRTFFGCTLLLLAAGLAHAADPSELDSRKPAPSAAPSREPVAVPKDYLLGPGDVLEISVWKEEDMKRDVMVRPDGGITFPLAGDVRAGGKTVDQLNDELTRILGEYLSEPVVHVAVMKVGQTIYVLGNVTKPGEFPMVTPIDVMQALALAGGLTPFADTGDIKIIRRDSHNRVTTLSFDYDDVSDGEELEQNILLRRGDVVVVP